MCYCEQVLSPTAAHHTKETFDAEKDQNLESKESLQVAKEDHEIDLQTDETMMGNEDRLLVRNKYDYKVDSSIWIPTSDIF